VFTSRVGTPTEPRQLKADFDAKIERLGLTQIRVHDLRHTCATLLLSQDVHPKVVQEMLGHSTISLTLDTYSHVLPTMQEDAAKLMERVLGSA
jgi:integrase